jgi:hypothetical protein
MPNYCFNSLRIIGPAEDIKTFVEQRLDFQHFVPCGPDECSSKWGTKWGPIDFEVEYVNEFDCKVIFRTAWGPPIPFLKALNLQHPSCWFKLEYEVELGWGSGIWIHSLCPNTQTPICQTFEWKEPPNYPMENGAFLLPTLPLNPPFLESPPTPLKSIRSMESTE